RAVRPFCARGGYAEARKPVLGPARLVQLCVDGSGCLCRDSGNAFELLLGSGEDALRGPEMPQQSTAAHGTDALERVEDRLARACIASLAMEADREAVRLVADALEELQPGRMRVEKNGVGPAGQEDLLDPFRERDHSHPGEIEPLHRR